MQPFFFFGGQLDSLHSAATSVCQTAQFCCCDVVLIEVNVVGEVFNATVHVVSCITAVLQHPCFYLLNKIAEPVFLSSRSECDSTPICIRLRVPVNILSGKAHKSSALMGEKSYPLRKYFGDDMVLCKSFNLTE